MARLGSTLDPQMLRLVCSFLSAFLLVIPNAIAQAKPFSICHVTDQLHIEFERDAVALASERRQHLMDSVNLWRSRDYCPFHHLIVIAYPEAANSTNRESQSVLEHLRTEYVTRLFAQSGIPVDRVMRWDLKPSEVRAGHTGIYVQVEANCPSAGCTTPVSPSGFRESRR